MSIRYIIVSALCIPLLAQASLGEKISVPATNSNNTSINVNNSNTSTSSKSALKLNNTPVSSNYTISTTTENNVEVKQYVNNDGYVFAVSWAGPVKPNLASLLGQYHEKLDGAVGRTSLRIQDSDIVIQSQGRLRHFSGFAYLPKITPVNFNAQ